MLVAQLTHTGAGAQSPRRAARRPHLPGSGRGARQSSCRRYPAPVPSHGDGNAACRNNVHPASGRHHLAGQAADSRRIPPFPTPPHPHIAAPAPDAIAGLVAAAATAATTAMTLESAPGPTSGRLSSWHRHHNAAWRAATASSASGTGKCTNKLNRRRATMAR